MLTGLPSGLGSDKGLATTLALRSGSIACEDADSVEDGNCLQWFRLGVSLGRGPAG